MKYSRHRKALAVAMGLTACLIAPGCSAYRVMQLPDVNARTFHSVPGVPFYVKRSACRQETVYQQDLQRIRLLVERLTLGAGGAVTRRDTTFDQVKLVPIDSTSRRMIQVLKDLVPAADTNSQKVTNAFDSLRVYDPAADWGPTSVLISNQVTSTVFVDYSTTYYLNVPRPIVGSATSSFKLNPDGTLGEGSATIDDSTLSALGGLIPSKEILTHLFVPTAAQPSGAESVVPTPREQFHYTLTVEAAPLLHTLARTEVQALETCAQKAAIPTGDFRVTEYTRKPLTAVAEAPQPPKNAITISGQLVLPPKP